MSKVNQALRDEQLWNKIRGGKDAARIHGETLKITGQLRREVLSTVRDALEKLDASTINPARLARVLRPLAKVSNALFDEVYQTLSDSLISLSETEAVRQHAAIMAAFPSDAAAAITVISASGSQIAAAALSQPMQGKLISDWLTGLSDNSGYRSLMPQIENAVRNGVLRGASYADIKGSIDSVVNGVELNVRSIVTTAVNHIQAEARDQTYESNTDLFNGYEWVSTLDNHTTPICQFRDHTIWRDVDGVMTCITPGKTKANWLNGPGKAHWGCRSVKVPVVKSWQQLGIDRAELTEGTRASMDGQVAESEDFGGWIARQVAKAAGGDDIAYSRLEDLYGVQRATGLVTGKLKYPELFNEAGTGLKPLK